MHRTKLIRGIVLAALVAIAIFPLYTMVVEYPMFTRLLMENAVDESQRIAHHLASSAAASNQVLSNKTIDKEFLADVETITRNFGLIKIKIFAPSGLILFSTDPKDIGTVNREVYFHERVSAGENFAKVIKKDSRTLEGQLVRRDVVETYIPLMSGAHFLGAFEIYLDITDERQRLNVLLGRSYLIVSLIALLLLGTVISSSVRANRSIGEREHAEARIKRINADLSILFEISSASGKTLDLDSLLASVLKTVTRQEFLRFKNKGGIFIVEGDALHLRSHLGHSENFLAKYRAMKIGESLCGLAAQTGEVIIARDDDAALRHIIREEGAPPEGHVIVPLKSATAVVGVLYLYIPIDTEVDENARRLLVTIGSKIGMSIENARLFAKTLELSLRDPLTGLANRRFLDIMLDNSIGIARRYNTPLSVLMADIDFFKNYNDTHGHAAGDEILVQTAEIIRSSIREIDLAVRYGGEEFLILLPETACERAREVAERMRIRIQEQGGVTISIGATCFRHDNETKAELVGRADEALYRSKREGRNRVTLVL